MNQCYTDKAGVEFYYSEHTLHRIANPKNASTITLPEDVFSAVNLDNDCQEPLTGVVSLDIRHLKYTNVFIVRNHMFPDIENIIVNEHGNMYFDSKDKVLVSGRTLLNVFSKRSGEFVIPRFVVHISDFAFEGTMFEDIDLKNAAWYDLNSFTGSVFEQLHPYIVICNIICEDGQELALPTYKLQGTERIKSKTLYPIQNNVNIKDFDVSTVDKVMHPERITFGNLIICREDFSKAAGLTESKIMRIYWNEQTDPTESELKFMMDESLEIDIHTPSFESLDGVLFSNDKKILIKYPKKNTEDSYDIPYGTEIIKEHAFASARLLHHITIPDTVRYICPYALTFSSIEEIRLPKSMRMLASNALSNCSYLRTVEIPGNVKSIGEGALSGCVRLNSVILGEGVESISAHVFSDIDKSFASGGTGLEIDLPKSVKYLQKGSLSSARKITVNSPDVTNLIIAAGTSSTYIETTWNSRKYLIPRSLSDTRLNELNEAWNCGMFDEAYDRLGELSSAYNGWKLFNYLVDPVRYSHFEEAVKQRAYTMAYNIVARGTKKYLLPRLLQSGLISYEELKELLDMAEQKNDVTLKAYIMDAINQSSDDKKSDFSSFGDF